MDLKDIWLSLLTKQLQLTFLEVSTYPQLSWNSLCKPGWPSFFFFKVKATNNLIVKFSVFSFCPVYLLKKFLGYLKEHV